MSSRKPLRKQIRSLCAEPGPEDGVDPRTAGRGPSGRVPNRKALQLCGQVARTLNQVLAESGDDQLRELLVTSVRSAPTASRLLVTVLLPAEAAAGADQVREHLRRASGWLRGEVAAAINRRKAPDLTFQVAAPGDEMP